MIAAELKIDVPDISFLELKNFLKNTKNIHFSTDAFSREEKVYFERNNRKYPWERRILEYEGKVFYDCYQTLPFSKLKNFIDFLPIIENTRVVVLLYQNKQDEYDFNFHFDKDEQFGFRICYNLDTSLPFLEFSKLKKNFLYVRNTLEQIKPFMVEDNVYELVPTKKNTVFMFDGLSYPHRVPVINNESERLSIIVRGKLGNIENLKFCQIIE